MEAIFTGVFPDSIPIFSYLLEHVNMQAVFVLKKNTSNAVIKTLEESKTPVIVTSEATFNNDLSQFILKKGIEIVVVYGCPIKISTTNLKLPTYGILNIHPGKFPENRGADPVFWSIKNQEKSTALTIHKMDANFDTGPILLQQSVPVHFGETSGMLNSKLSLLAVEVLKKALGLVTDPLNYRTQDDLKKYTDKPCKKDLFIDWENQTAEEIESLVNACNPKYVGATTYYQGSEINIIEVSQVDNATPMFGKTPGEIVHANPQQGLFVCCKYGQLLRINIMKSDAGVLTGHKYARIGIQMGQRFTTRHSLKTELIIK